MSSAIYALIALALVSAGGAGIAIRSMDATPQASLTTVEGKVTEVEWNPHWNVSVEFKLQTSGPNATTYEVELGPPWWWAEQKYPVIKVNDTVKVEGVLEEGNEIQAHTIWINGGSAIEIRGFGMPPWAQARSEEHEQNGSDDHEDSD